jgi:hypothetical protein
MYRLLLALFLLLALAPAASAATATPLQQRLISAGEITGYKPVNVRTLGLAGYARAAGLDARSRSQLTRSGLVDTAIEALHAPRALPSEAGPSQSSVLEFDSPHEAAAFLHWLHTTYIKPGRTEPPGITQTSFAIPGVPGVIGLHTWGQTRQGRLDEYDALLVRGRYLQEVDVFAQSRDLPHALAQRELAAYFNRLGDA